MPRELFDVQRQNFWTESIHKEAYTRLAWHEKYSKEFARESRQGEVLKIIIIIIISYESKLILIFPTAATKNYPH